MKWSDGDIKFMERALELAAKARGWARPNPMVGAVLVKDGKVIGEGYHHQDGEDHAEVDAFKNATEDVEGATMYVTLEPCSFDGRTGACARKAINAKLKRVVVAMLDPMVKVAGRGVQMMQEAGIEVEVGLCQRKARELNEVYMAAHVMQRPYVAVKFACSLDGRIATRTGDSKWITGEDARKFGRDLRGEYQAIVVGIGTVLADDPNLGVRDARWQDPLRVVLDSRLRIPVDAAVLRDGNVLVVTTQKASRKKLRALEEMGVYVVELGKERIDLEMLMQKLWEMRVTSVYVEGGGEVIGSFVDERLVERVYVFQAAMVIGGKDAKSAVGGVGPEKVSEALRLEEVKRVVLGEDLLTTGRVVRF